MVVTSASDVHKNHELTVNVNVGDGILSGCGQCRSHQTRRKRGKRGECKAPTVLCRSDCVRVRCDATEARWEEEDKGE